MLVYGTNAMDWPSALSHMLFWPSYYTLLPSSEVSAAIMPATYIENMLIPGIDIMPIPAAPVARWKNIPPATPYDDVNYV